VELRRGDLTDRGDTVCRGCDAVVFAAGPGSSTGAEMTDAGDRQGARRLIDLAIEGRVERPVVLSSMGAGDPDADSSPAGNGISMPQYVHYINETNRLGQGGVGWKACRLSSTVSPSEKTTIGRCSTPSSRVEPSPTVAS